MRKGGVRKVVDIFEHCPFFMLNLIYELFYLIMIKYEE